MLSRLACLFLHSVVRLIQLVLPTAQLTFQRLSSDADLSLFQEEYWRRDGVRFPLEYLRGGSCYLVRNVSSALVGGFAVIRESDLRTLRQIPGVERQRFLQSLERHETVVETTGVWLEKQPHRIATALAFWLRVFEETYLAVPYSVNVFACDLRKPGLVRLYRSICTGIVYAGRIEPLAGMEDNGAEEEIVFFGRLTSSMRGFCRELGRRLVKTGTARTYAQPLVSNS